MIAVRTAFNLFCDCWKLYRKYIAADLDEENLDRFIQESEEVFRKYEQDLFAKDLLLVVTNEIERKIKN